MPGRYVILLAAVLLGCRDVAAPDSFGERLSVLAITNSDMLAKEDLGYVSSAHFIVRDSATWDSTWRRLYSSFRPVPPLPAVDFDRHSVVVAVPSLQPLSFGAHVDSITFYDGGARVFVSQIEASHGGIPEVYAFTHVVRTPRLSVVDFHDRTRNVSREGWP